MLLEKDSKEMFSMRLREERQKLGMSRAKLAEVLSVKSASTIGNWETGASFPDFNMLSFMADLFSVTTDYLLGRSDVLISHDVERTEYDVEVFEQVLKIERCDEIGQEAIFNCIDFHHARCMREPEKPEHDQEETESINGMQRIFLRKDLDADYDFMKEKLVNLRNLRKSKKKTKSFIDITKHLWELGYGDEICLAYVLDIFGKGVCERVPNHRLYDDIDRFLRGKYITLPL